MADWSKRWVTRIPEFDRVQSLQSLNWVKPELSPCFAIVWLKIRMWGLGLKRPNCGGVLMVGLGCETNQIDDLMANYGLSDNN